MLFKFDHVALIVTAVVLLINAQNSGGSSCENRCGDGLDSSQSCQCNEDCVRFSDCCSDYQRVCNSQSEGSCVGRCGSALDRTQSCQCNSNCLRFSDCCTDYQTVCQSGSAPNPDPPASSVITNAELSALGEALWAADVDRFQDSELRLNLRQSSTRTTAPFFYYVDETRFEEARYRLFINLLDNYHHRTGEREPALDAEERAETEEYLDHLISSPVIRELINFLLSKGKIVSEGDLRAILNDVWFEFYSRSSSSNMADSSGFEHVFVGEHKSSSVTGFHSWVQMYLLERNGELEYLGYNYLAEPGLYDNHFLWNNLEKKRASMFVGSSPDFDVALYTMCLLARPGSVCETKINGHSVYVQTYDVSHQAGLQVASAFPMVNGP